MGRVSHCSLRGKKGKGVLDGEPEGRRSSRRRRQRRARQVLSEGARHPAPRIPGLGFAAEEDQRGSENTRCVKWPLEDGSERNKVGGREIEELFTSIYKRETGEKVLGYFRM